MANNQVHPQYRGSRKECQAMNEWYEQAKSKLAQAVAQGGTFADCMKAVAKSCGSAISDLEAFRRAVRFYFPGADVKFHMTVNLCADVEAEAAAAAPVASTGPKILDLEDFL